MAASPETRGEGQRPSPLGFVTEWVRAATRWGASHIHLAPAFFALAVYLRTLAPDVYVSDFAEFQYQPYVLGLPHPNGFPLYMLGGWVWSHLLWGDVAWRMNLLSALAGAAAVAVTAQFAYRVSRSRAIGTLAGILLGFTHTFWGYSLLAERYTLNLALMVASLWWAWEVGTRSTGQRRWALGSALWLGLGLAVHPSDALLVPFWLGLLGWRLGVQRFSAKVWAQIGLALVAPLVLYVYVPWRWAAFASWPLLPGINRSLAVYQGLVHVWYEPPLRWDLVLYYITGLGGYATGLLGGGWYEAVLRLNTLWPVWRAEVPWWVALGAVIGWPRVWNRARDLALLLPGFAVFLTLMVAYIQQGKNEAYLLPAFWVVYFIAAFALDWLPFRWASPVRGAVPLVALAVLVVPQYTQLDLSRRVDIREWWEAVLQLPVEPGSALLGHWSDFTPLWYLQHIEGKRPDLVALFPPDVERVIQPWLDTGNPLYLAAPTHGWAPDLAERYHLVPWGRLVRIMPHDERLSCFRQLERSPDHKIGPLEISQPWGLEAPLRPTRPASFLFCWRTEAPVDKRVFAAVRLEPIGEGQAMEFHAPLLVGWDPRESVGPSTEGLGQVVVTPPLGAMPGEYSVSLFFFKLEADGTATPWAGGQRLELGRTSVEASVTFDRAYAGNATVPLISPRVGPLTLRAWRLSDKPVRPGDPVVLQTWWEVNGALSGAFALDARFWHSLKGPVASEAKPLVFPASLPARPTVVRAEHVFRAPKGVGDTWYALELRVKNGDQGLRWWPWPAVFVGVVRVKDRPHVWVLPEGGQPIEAEWPNVARLVKYALEPTQIRPGQTLTVTLYWQAVAYTDQSYKVFVHLVGPDGQIVTQHDAFPAQNTLPTDLWVPGEIIVDPHPLLLPQNIPPGTYTVLVGLYHPETGERVAIRTALPVQNRALVLTTLQVPGTP